MNGVQENTRRDVLINGDPYLKYLGWIGDYAGRTIWARRVFLVRSLESHFNFLEFGKMIFCKPAYFILLLITFLFGCGTQLALSGQAREDYLKSIKAYGEYFVKPEVSREEWQRDWVACGERSNGQYSDDAPPDATTKEIFAAIGNARNSLDTCMKSKGYEYRVPQ